jgi:(2S)-methylsuccinyl-CoA dehydrogenase
VVSIVQTKPLRQAFDCVNALRTEVDAALTHLNRLCTVDGEFSAPKLDAHQKVSYELAFCVAELEASEVMLDYANKASAEDALCEPLSLAFCADNLRAVWQRLLTHSAEAGLSNSRLLQLMGSDPLADFLAEHGTVAQFAAIGAELLARSSLRLPSGLGEEKDMIRDSFARFAEEVVMPQAEHIHRFDTDIPDEIISGAAEM